MFHDWLDFYMMLGPAAATLIGLLFVVATLTTGREHASVSLGARAFMTPTAFHLALVLTLSAFALFPGQGLVSTTLIYASAAAAGLVYSTWIGLRLRPGAPSASAHWSDFWFYAVAPAAAYATLGASAAGLWRDRETSLYGAALAILALLLVAIRNAWDLVTWLAPRRGGV